MTNNSETVDFCFVWRIENFFETYDCLWGELSSPTYVTKATFIAEWELILKCDELSNEVLVYLKRGDFAGPPKLMINCEISLCTENGALFFTDNVEGTEMASNSKLKLLNFTEIFEKCSMQNKRLPGQSLIFICNITFPPLAISAVPWNMHDLCLDVSQLLTNHQFSDLKLVSGNSIFQVHKALLWARARKMVEHFHVDEPSRPVWEVHVKDMDPEVLEGLIFYLYSGEVVCPGTVLWTKLQQVAEKYEINDLKKTLCVPAKKLVTYTRILFQSLSFRWSIQNFSSLALYKKLELGPVHIPSGSIVITFQLIIEGFRLYLSKLSNHDISKEKFGTVKVTAVRKDGHLRLLCSGSLSDISEEYELGIVDDGPKYVLQNKSHFIQNDELNLDFSFLQTSGTLRAGIEHTELETEFMSESMKNVWSLKDDLTTLLENSKYSDINLRVEGQVLPAHRAILSQRSPVLANKLKHSEMMNDAGILDIENVDLLTMKNILNYLYSSCIQLETNKQGIDLYAAADRYAIWSLKEELSKWIKKILNIENAIDILLLADLHKDVLLKTFAQNFICNSASQVLGTEEWKLLVQQRNDLASEIMLRLTETIRCYTKD